MDFGGEIGTIGTLEHRKNLMSQLGQLRHQAQNWDTKSKLDYECEHSWHFQWRYKTRNLKSSACGAKEDDAFFAGPVAGAATSKTTPSLRALCRLGRLGRGVRLDESR